MVENRNEIDIQATPEEIWAVLTDMGRHAEWNPLIYRAEGKVEVGHRVRLSARNPSRDMSFTCLVVSVEPNRAFTWKWHVVLPFLIRGEHEFKIEPISGQSARFVNREIFRGLLVPMLARELKTDGKVGMEAMDQALKERVERLERTDLGT